MNHFNSLINYCLESIFPTHCFKCGMRGSYICIECIQTIPKSEANEKGFISIFQYRDPSIRTMLWSLKYKGTHSIASTCAQILYDELFEILSEKALLENFKNPLIVPIPLSKKRERERGFNQAELIAKEFAVLDDSFIFAPNILKRTKDTKSQTAMKNRTQRIKNVIGCFEVENPKSVRDKNIILIDDIYTTGATLSEARKVLLKSGAREVLVCTIAH